MHFCYISLSIRHSIGSWSHTTKSSCLSNMNWSNTGQTRIGQKRTSQTESGQTRTGQTRTGQTAAARHLGWDTLLAGLGKLGKDSVHACVVEGQDDGRLLALQAYRISVRNTHRISVWKHISFVCENISHQCVETYRISVWKLIAFVCGNLSHLCVETYRISVWKLIASVCGNLSHLCAKTYHICV